MTEEQKLTQTRQIIVCGCFFSDSRTVDTEITDNTPLPTNGIHFCPLHAKAQEMYEILASAVRVRGLYLGNVEALLKEIDNG